jgi:hypothetical protein
MILNSLFLENRSNSRALELLDLSTKPDYSIMKFEKCTAIVDKPFS